MSTIAAISTPLSASGLGVIRISGEDAVAVGEKMFRPFKGGKELSALKGYSCAYGRVFDAEGDIDEAVATVFLAPKSYTGENTVEFSCHGSPALLKRVLRAALDCGAGTVILFFVCDVNIRNDFYFNRVERFHVDDNSIFIKRNFVRFNL